MTQRLAFILAILVASSATAKPHPCRYQGRGYCADARRLETLSPVVAVQTSPLYCTAARQLGLLTGSYACLNGDGTQDSSAGMTLSAVGSPTTQVLASSPNGNNSTAVARQVLSGATDYFKTASVAAPAGDFSACWVGIATSPLSNSSDLFGQDDGTTHDWMLRAQGNGSLTLYTNGTAGTQAASSLGALPVGSEDVVCATFHANGATSTGTVYVDGSQVAQSTTMGVPAGGSVALTVARAAATNFVGRVRGAFFTSKLLTATDVSRLAAALIPTPQTASGVALSNSRNSASWVTTSDGTLVALPPGRTGVVGVPGDTASSVGGAVSAPSRTTLNLYSEQLDQTGTGKWVTAGTISVAQNASTSPDGALMADTVTGSSTGTVNFLYQPFTATGGGYTISGWGKAGTSAAGVLRIWDNTASAELCHSSPASGASLARVSCSVASTTNGHTIWAIVYPAGMTTGNTGSSTWFGVQFEQSAVLNPYCRSEATSATCSGDVITVPTPGWLSTKEGCSKVCVTPTWTGSNQSAVYFLSGNSGGTARLLWLSGGAISPAAFDGALNAFAPGTLTAGVRTCFVTRWSASGGWKRIDNLTTATQGTPQAFAGFPSFDSTISIGSNGASFGQPLGSIIDSVTLGSSPGGCN